MSKGYSEIYADCSHLFLASNVGANICHMFFPYLRGIVKHFSLPNELRFTRSM